MILGKALDGFANGTPVCMMIRSSLEYASSEEFVNEIFEATAEKQYRAVSRRTGATRGPERVEEVHHEKSPS